MTNEVDPLQQAYAEAITHLSRGHDIDLDSLDAWPDLQPAQLLEALGASAVSATPKPDLPPGMSRLSDVLEAAAAAVPEDQRPVTALADNAWLQRLLPNATVEADVTRQGARWIAEVCDALAPLHRKGRADGRIRPACIAVDPNGQAVLLAAPAANPPQTTNYGNPLYRAPESWRAAAPPTPQMDVYSLCATLYHLATMQPPYTTDYSGAELQSHREAPSPAQWLNEGLPPGLVGILDRGLEHNATRRHSDAGDLGAALRGWLEDGAVPSPPHTASQRFLRRAARQPMRYAATAIAVLLVLALTLGAPAWGALQTANSMVTQREIYRDLPPSVGVDRATTGRADTVTRLRELAAAAPREPSPRVLLALALEDAGQGEAATAQWETLYGITPSPFAAAMRDASRSASNAVDPTSLPNVRTPVDRYAKALWLCRGGAWRDAATLLESNREHLPSLSLLCHVRAHLLQPGDEPARSELVATVATVEKARGARTARTIHAAATAHFHAGDLAAARASLQLALDLCADDPALRDLAAQLAAAQGR